MGIIEKACRAAAFLSWYCQTSLSEVRFAFTLHAWTILSSLLCSIFFIKKRGGGGTTLFFLLYKHKTSHHSGTTICRSANIWNMPHYMYLIIRVIPNSGKHNDTIVISAEKHN
jgi:hypothetical protein